MANIGASAPRRTSRQITIFTLIPASSTHVTGNVRPETHETVLTLIAERTIRFFPGQPRREPPVVDAFGDRGIRGVEHRRASAAAGQVGRASRPTVFAVTAGAAIALGAKLARAGLDAGFGPLGRRAFTFGLVTGRSLLRLWGTLTHWAVQPLLWKLARCTLTNTQKNYRETVETEFQLRANF